jgi:hypothetical protein
MILAGQFTDWWAYLTAPLAGGVAAVALYDRFLRAGRTVHVHGSGVWGNRY